MKEAIKTQLRVSLEFQIISHPFPLMGENNLKNNECGWKA